MFNLGHRVTIMGCAPRSLWQIIDVFELHFPEYMTLEALDTKPIPESLASTCAWGGVRGPL